MSSNTTRTVARLIAESLVARKVDRAEDVPRTATGKIQHRALRDATAPQG